MGSSLIFLFDSGVFYSAGLGLYKSPLSSISIVIWFPDNSFDLPTIIGDGGAGPENRGIYCSVLLYARAATLVELPKRCLLAESTPN